MTDATVKSLTSAQIEALLLRLGWRPTKTGTLVKQGPKALFRIRFMTTSLRIDAKRDVDGSNWVRVGGDFYRNVKLHGDGRMQIGSDFFGK